MGEMMELPETPEEFIKQYSFKDKEEIYTNGSELIPVFRVEQMLEHYKNKLQAALPERIDPRQAKSSNEAAYIEGWNECINKILGGLNE